MIRRHPYLSAFTGAYSIAFLGWALSRGNTEFIFYFVVMLVLIVLVYWADRRVIFPAIVLWMLSIWGLLHMAGGNVPVPADGIGFGSTAVPGESSTVLYNLWLLPGRCLKYDQITHAYGFFAATSAVWHALRRTLGTSVPWTLGVFVVTATAGMGLGAVNEIVEYIATLRGPTNVGGYANNAQDLIFNAIGACCAAFAAAIESRRVVESPKRSLRPIFACLALAMVLSVFVGGTLARITGDDGVSEVLQSPSSE